MDGGEGGIRTHGTRKGTPHFECGAFDHSATSPTRNGAPEGAGEGEGRKLAMAPGGGKPAWTPRP